MGKDYDEIASVVRKSQTFAIRASFKRASAQDDDSPMNIYGGGNLSRFPVTLIENGRAVTANIPVVDAPYIFKRCEFAINKAMERECAPPAEISSRERSIAYTVKLSSARYKCLNGRSPARAFLDGYKAELNEHYKWLSQNLQKYPRNKEQMDAIREAGKLASEGKLDECLAPQAEVVEFEIYNSGPRGSRRDEKESEIHPGTYFCYELSIAFRFDKEYPVVVRIENYYAPIIKLEDGRQNVEKSKMVRGEDKDAPATTEMRMSIAEMSNILYRMQMSMRNFEVLNAKACYTEFVEHDKAVRQRDFKNRVAV